ncbi:MAG: PA14 domain-containing protein, partial [Verrucomicrobiales bacterium]
SGVWGLGVRHPMRMTLKPGTGNHSPAAGDPGVLYIGDVGWGSAEDMEVADGPGKNFGWPLYEGYNQVSSYWNVRPAGMNASDRSMPRCSWRSNAFVLTPAGTTQRFGASGTTVPGPNFSGNCSIGGVWYTGTDFPEEWRNTYFHADFGAKWIRAFTMDANHFVTEQRWFITDGSITGLATHPELGGLYYVNWGGSVKRIRYAASGNRPPTAVATVSHQAGPSPLAVSFSSLGSQDPESGALSYTWDFGDSTTSSEPHPTKTYTATGAQTFTATLTVRDAANATDTASTVITVNNAAPTVVITSPPLGATFPISGSAVTLPLTASVVAPGHAASAMSYRWQTLLYHNTHSHAEQEQTTAVASAVLTPLAPTPADFYYYKIVLTVTDPLGAHATAERLILPESAPAGVPPIAALGSPPPVVSTSFTVPITFNESVTGLSAADFAIDNGSALLLEGAGVSYTLTVAPANTGPVTVGLPAGSCQDTEGLSNGAGLPVTTFFLAPPPPPQTDPGLKAEYFAGENFNSLGFTRIDPHLEFYRPGTTSPGPGIPGDYYTVRWTGRISPPTSGSWQFFADVDDGLRLWVNGQLLLDHWNPPPAVYWGLSSTPIVLTGGVDYDIRVDYQDFYSDSYLALRWASPSVAQQSIPATAFTQPVAAPDTVSPGVTLAAPSAVTAPFVVTASFTEIVEGLSAADFVVTNGTATSLTGAGSAYSVNVTPTTAGLVTVRLPAAAAQDAAGNPSLASNEIIVAYSEAPATNAPGLKAEYFIGENLGALALTRVDPRFEFYWPGPVSPGPDVPGDYFSARWTGRLTPPATGSWQFFADVDDGLRLWLDGQLVLDHWNRPPAVYWGLSSTPVNLTAGVPVDIRLEYQDFFSDAYLLLRWAGPATPQQLIPASALMQPPSGPDLVAPSVTLSAPGSVTSAFALTASFSEPVVGVSASDFIVTNGSASGLAGSGSAYTVTIAPVTPGPVTVRLPAAAATDDAGNPSLASNEIEIVFANPPPTQGPGLKGEYFAGAEFSSLALTRIDPRLEFYWPDTIAPGPGVPGDYFSVRWSGRLTPPATGSWQFFVDVDDGLRLWVDGQLVLDHWNRAPAVYWGLTSTPIQLAASVPVDLRVEYQDFFSDAYLVLRWAGPGTLEQTVPASAYSLPAHQVQAANSIENEEESSGQLMDAENDDSLSAGFASARAALPRMEDSLVVVPNADGTFDLGFVRPRQGRLAIVLQVSSDMATWHDVRDPGWPVTQLPDGMEHVHVSHACCLLADPADKPRFFRIRIGP